MTTHNHIWLLQTCRNQISSLISGKRFLVLFYDLIAILTMYLAVLSIRKEAATLSTPVLSSTLKYREVGIADRRVYVTRSCN